MLLLSVASAAESPGAVPAIDSMPVVSPEYIVANGSTQFTITMTSSDADGYDDLADMRILLNYTESGGEEAYARGYLAWGADEAAVNHYGGTWNTGDASGGGKWGINTSEWGGTTYLDLVSCQTSVAGAASGTSGSRTVTWTCVAKAIWGQNPTFNDADAWTRDASDATTGWKDNPSEFCVLRNSCAGETAVPGAPPVGSPSTSTLTLTYTDDGTSVYYLISVEPSEDEERYVQADGSLGFDEVWQPAVNWSGTVISGLRSGVQYTFRARAWDILANRCPSGWGVEGYATTAAALYAVDADAAGIPISSGVRGIDHHPWNNAQYVSDEKLEISHGTQLRWAGDGYVWTTRSWMYNCSDRTTLQTLRWARDVNSTVQILVNSRGKGEGEGDTWQYTDQSPAACVEMAEDLVYYCNVLVQNKRQGDALTGEEQALLDKIDWGDDDKLLAPGEDPVPPVTYWEVGNEPEGPFPPPALTPEEYEERYRLMSQAMLAVDPTIRVGPTVMHANEGNAWLDEIFTNSANQVDFVCYHPYGYINYMVEGLDSQDLPAVLAEGLNDQREAQITYRDNILARVSASGRSVDDMELLASEWNPANWRGYSIHPTMGQALGCADTVLVFAELGFTACQYWANANYGLYGTGYETPLQKMFLVMQEHLGDTLLVSHVEHMFRLYATKKAGDDTIVLWGINLSHDTDKTLRVQLQNVERKCRLTSLQLAEHGADETSLATKNSTSDGYERVTWATTEHEHLVDAGDLEWTLPHSTLTLLVLEPTIEAAVLEVY